MINWLNQLDFIVRAVIAGVGVSLMAGPLGTVIVWRKMTYFGETLAHSTLLGASLAFAFHLNIYVGLFFICLAVSFVLAGLSLQKQLASDAILGLLAHTTLSVGLIVATSLSGMRIDILSYLYGDILAVNGKDLLWILGTILVAMGLLKRIWPGLVMMSIHEELAFVEGVPTRKVQWTFILLMGLIFAVAMKLVGVLLITALLIIPPSAARQVAKSPEAMAMIASLFGVISVVAGIYMSLIRDWPTGPSIVIVSTLIFIISLLVRSKSQKKY